MKRHSTVIIVLAGSLVILSMLGCSVGRQIVKGPNTPTATPTATRRPTFTATASATPLPPMTNTPLPTNTPEVPPTATPTNTAEVPPTETPKPEPPTNTPKPTEPPQPAPPPPTDTPVPEPAAPPPTATPSTPYVGRIVTGFPNCGSTGIFGYVKDAGGGVVTDAYVHVWTDTWEGDWSKSKGATFGGAADKDDDNDRNYELAIAGVGVAAGSWHVAITDGRNLTLLSPIYEITTSQNCEGDGAVQWVQVDFTKNY